MIKGLTLVLGRLLSAWILFVHVDEQKMVVNYLNVIDVVSLKDIYQSMRQK